MTTQTHTNDAIQASFDADTGVASLIMKMPGSANKVDETFGRGLADALAWAKGVDGLKGLIIGSAHKHFCVGADIEGLAQHRDPQATYDYVKQLNALFREIETAGVPVVCALTGSALGGGYELALSCHHRIAIDSGRVQIGLPEVSLGVIPGAGGTQRLPRIIGIQKALEHISMGQPVRAPKAKKLGMVDDLAADRDEVMAKAHAWIAANPKAKQPWDKKGFAFPPPTPRSEDARNIFLAAAAMLYKKTAGTMPQIEAAVAGMQEGVGLDFDSALLVEHRYFVRCATSQQAQDMIRTFWFHRNAALKAEGLPRVADHGFERVGILGAGMMGAGLAFVCASKGLGVVLKDITEPALEAARAHCAAQVKKRRHLSAEAQQAILDRITFTLDQGDLQGVDLIIEAVVENDEVKHAVTRETEPLLSANGIWASNTSAIPITHLAKASAHPDRFIGLHFFSPVEKMPLLEIIAGADTSDETLGRCVAFGQLIGKLPILVNDGYGFYTSRVFGTYLMEAVQLVSEGHDPVLIEWAAREAGMVVPPLKVFDEVTLRLGYKGIKQRERYLGEDLSKVPGVELLRKMVEDHGRLGKVEGKGFYDYDGRDRRIWPGLAGLAGGIVPAETGVAYLKDRLMLRQVVEVARCLEENILRTKRDAEVGAVFGIGFSPGAGGPLAWMDARGIDRVVSELQALSKTCGDRFEPPKLLVDMAANGERFFG